MIPFSAQRSHSPDQRTSGGRAGFAPFAAASSRLTFFFVLPVDARGSFVAGAFDLRWVLGGSPSSAGVISLSASKTTGAAAFSKSMVGVLAFSGLSTRGFGSSRLTTTTSCSSAGFSSGTPFLRQRTAHSKQHSKQPPPTDTLFSAGMRRPLIKCSPELPDAVP